MYRIPPHPARFSFSTSALFVIFCLAAPSVAQAQAIPQAFQIVAGDHVEDISPKVLASWFHFETVLALKDKRSEAADTWHCPIDRLFCDFSLSRATRSKMAVVLDNQPDRAGVVQFVSDLATQINREPTDVKFGVNDQNQIVIVTPEQIGRKIKEVESVDLIYQSLAESSDTSLKVALAIDVVQPKFVGADQERLGLKELIGEGKTDFKGSPKNRLFNINRSLEQFENLLIAPGEEFSFVDYLGEVDGEHGYLPELVIKYNKTEPEFGGGICQVSSTVFRAAIYSGLKITERRNHAYAVQYYKPYGMDATIYIPKPDLRFTNNTPGHILIQSVIEGDNLIFRFFGTKDGRTVSIDGPHILERGGDGSMKTVFTQEVNNGEGQNFIRDSFYSNYRSPALFPHPGQETDYTEKPKGWSEKQWKAYRATRS